MTLRTRTRLIFAIALIGLLAGLYLGTYTIVLNGFATLEQDNTRQNVERVRNALDIDLTSLDRTVGDWAYWDDTYRFVQDSNAEFVQLNLGAQSLAQINVNLIVCLDTSGRIVFQKAIDLQKKTEITPPDLSEYIRPGAALITHTTQDSSVTGLVRLSSTPMLVASRSILTSEATGPSRGTLIMGRFLDDAAIKDLADTTHLALTAYAPGKAELPDDVRHAQASLIPTAEQPTPTFVQARDANTVAGYTALYDLLNQPVEILRVDIPRSIYAQGQTSMRYFVVALCLVVAVFGAITWYAIERMVISQHLSREMEERYRSVIATSPDAIGLTTLGGTWMMVNPQALKLFGASSQEQFGDENLIGAVMPDHQEQIIADLKRVRRGDVIRQAEYPLRRMDGSSLSAELSLALVSDEDHRPEAFIVILRDISERKLTEQTLRDKIQSLSSGRALAN